LDKNIRTDTRTHTVTETEQSYYYGVYVELMQVGSIKMKKAKHFKIVLTLKYSVLSI